VERLGADDVLRARLAAAARSRFAAEFTLERHHRAYLDLYRPDQRQQLR
jgi:glycosyltransferase involved in cell wall biosynthesis